MTSKWFAVLKKQFKICFEQPSSLKNVSHPIFFILSDFLGARGDENLIINFLWPNENVLKISQVYKTYKNIIMCGLRSLHSVWLVFAVFRSLSPERPTMILIWLCWSRCTCNFVCKPRHEKTCIMTYANNNDVNQPAHLPNWTSAFVVCCLDSIIPILSKSNFFYLGFTACQVYFTHSEPSQS